jgi:hypothetical protein
MNGLGGRSDHTARRGAAMAGRRSLPTPAAKNDGVSGSDIDGFGFCIALLPVCGRNSTGGRGCATTNATRGHAVAGEAGEHRGAHGACGPQRCPRCKGDGEIRRAGNQALQTSDHHRIFRGHLARQVIVDCQHKENSSTFTGCPHDYPEGALRCVLRRTRRGERERPMPTADLTSAYRIYFAFAWQ